jgi:hypothetical protein
MKILLPENIEDISLSQYQRFEELNSKLENEEITLETYNKHKINLFSGIPFRKIEDVAHKDLVEVMQQIDVSLNAEAPFEERFKMNGIEYGLIPNFDNIAVNEYVDLNKYGVEVDTLHNLMAILFRPIVKKSLNNYDIAKYKGTSEHAETMKQMPMSLVNGALSFFFHLSSELENSILRFTREELAKKEQGIIFQNGDGMPLS